MSKTLSPQLLAAQLKIKADTHNLLVIASTEAVNHFKANFKVGGFVDRGVDKWKPWTGNKDPGRGILIGKGSGKLKRSIARSSMSATRVIIGVKGSPIKYASVHNFGLRAGRGKGFIMPQRKFMGDSHKLNQKISRLIKRRLNKIL
jgi:phage gpG-like protein